MSTITGWLPEDEHGVLTFTTFADATVTLTRPGRDDDAGITAYADGTGLVRLDVGRSAAAEDVELLATCVAGDRTEEQTVRLHTGDQRGTPLLREAFADRFTPAGALADLRTVASTGIDPLQAPADELAALGYPPRPDPDADEHAHAAWRRIATQPYLPVEGTRVRIERDRAEFRAGVHERITEPTVPPFVFTDTTSRTTTNWGGFAVTADGTPLTSVDGFWHVPEVSSPSGSHAETALWVGLDGWGAPNVLQAGTNSVCHPVLGWTLTYHYAWTEWYPQPAFTVTNMPVAPGDEVYFSVWFDGAEEHFLVGNMTRGYTYFLGPPLAFPPLTRPAFSGASAEWIVERPSLDKRLQPLAAFDRAVMTGCTARAGGALKTVRNAPFNQIFMMDGQPRTLSWAEGYLIPTITHKFVHQ